MNGLALALGVFVGNMLFHGLVGGDWKKGLAIGTIAAVLVLVFYAIRFTLP